MGHGTLVERSQTSVDAEMRTGVLLSLSQEEDSTVERSGSC